MEQKSSTHCSIKGSAKIVVFLILGVVILAAVGGFFYLQNMKGGEAAKSTPPKLFSKGDYKVEDRADGKYIVVDKVGLTAKVPDGWRVEFSNNTSQDINEYWVDLYSQDATGIDYLKKGCTINIIAGDEKENNQDIEQKIQITKGGVGGENCDDVFSDRVCEVYKINGKDALKWIDRDRGIAGQSLGIRIPVGTEKIISINATFSSSDKEKCSPAWEEFLKTIDLK